MIYNFNYILNYRMPKTITCLFCYSFNVNRIIVFYFKRSVYFVQPKYYRESNRLNREARFRILVSAISCEILYILTRVLYCITGTKPILFHLCEIEITCGLHFAVCNCYTILICIDNTRLNMYF